MSKTIKAHILAGIAFVAVATAIPQTFAAQGDIRDDPSYRGYLRWNGFPVESAADSSRVVGRAERKAGIEAKEQSGNIIDDPAYQAYLRWNGHPIQLAADQARVLEGAAGRIGVDATEYDGNIIDDPSYQAYLRWNGFPVR